MKFEEESKLTEMVDTLYLIISTIVSHKENIFFPVKCVISQRGERGVDQVRDSVRWGEGGILKKV